MGFFTMRVPTKQRAVRIVRTAIIVWAVLALFVWKFWTWAERDTFETAIIGGCIAHARQSATLAIGSDDDSDAYWNSATDHFFDCVRENGIFDYWEEAYYPEITG